MLNRLPRLLTHVLTYVKFYDEVLLINVFQCYNAADCLLQTWHLTSIIITDGT